MTLAPPPDSAKPQLAQIIYAGIVRARRADGQKHLDAKGRDLKPGDVLAVYATRENNGCAVWKEHYHPTHAPVKHFLHYPDRNEAIEAAVHQAEKERMLLDGGAS